MKGGSLSHLCVVRLQFKLRLRVLTCGPLLDALRPWVTDLLLLRQQDSAPDHLLPGDERDDCIVEVLLAVLEPDLAAEGVEEAALHKNTQHEQYLRNRAGRSGCGGVVVVVATHSMRTSCCTLNIEPVTAPTTASWTNWLSFIDKKYWKIMPAALLATGSAAAAGVTAIVCVRELLALVCGASGGEVWASRVSRWSQAR